MTSSARQLRVRSVDALHVLALKGASGGLPDWYDREGAAIASWAMERGFPVHRVADVVAVTSPQVPVPRNGLLARAYLETGSVKGLIPSAIAALAHYEVTGQIRGPKTRAFSAALQGDGEALVLDVHMLRAFDVRVLDGGRYKPVPQSALYARWLYPTLEARVRAVADREGWNVRDTQAAIWFGARRIKHGDSLGF